MPRQMSIGWTLAFAALMIAHVAFIALVFAAKFDNRPCYTTPLFEFCIKV